MLGVNNNIGGLRAQDAMSLNHKLLQVSLERLSTGVRINRADDDAAGLMLRDRFQAQMNGLEEAVRNIQTAQGMIQVAEDGLNRVTDTLQQMRQLAVRAADDNLTDTDRDNIQQQIRALLKEINDRAEKTRYNGHRLLDGSITQAVEEKKSSAKVSTNAILRDGSELVSIDLETSQYVTTFGAVSQGSYEVKLVYSDEQRAGLTGNTTLEGALNSFGGGQTANISQVIYDREGNAHNASFAFTQGAGHQWTYTVNIDGGGSFSGAVTASGAMTFKDVLGSDLDAMDTGKMVESSLTMTNSTGTLTPGNLTYVDTLNGTITLAIDDGTVTGQSYTVDFSSLVENEMDPAPIAAMPVLNQDGISGAQTATLDIDAASTLDDAAPINATTTTGASNWLDRTGIPHAVDMTLTKLADGDGINTGDTWKYSLSGVGQSGVWTGNNLRDQNVIVQFDVAGNVQSVNGAAGSTVTATIGDGTASGQQVEIDFANLTIGGVDAVTSTPDGLAGTPTTAVDFLNLGADNRLISGTGPITFNAGTFVDRTGTTGVSGFGVTFTQVGDSNIWNYRINAPSSSGFTGRITSGGSGQIEFQGDGDLVTNDPTKPVQFIVNFEDGTAEGQTFTLRLEESDPLSPDFNSGLKMASAADLRRTSSDGGLGADGPGVDAVVYWTDGGMAPVVVSTLEGVNVSAKAYIGGGVILTVNTVSRHDTGLVAFAKTLTYVTGTTQDNALQFQTGSDEGEVFRVGIQSMKVNDIFRMDFYQGEDVDGSISIATTLQAQDLMGQVDDALSQVSRANLVVGAFKNELDRTLELQRSNHTEITNAFSLVNDADMAMEATTQSKRSILIQSATAMIAQANTTSQFVLQLLR